MRVRFSCLVLVLCLLAGIAGASAAPLSPVETVRRFHHHITLGEFRDAIDMMTDAGRDAMGGYDGMVRGYALTQYSQPLELVVTEQTAQTARVAYTLQAADRTNESQLVLQSFACTRELKLDPITGQWLLDSGTGKLLSRTSLTSRDAAIAILKRYHACITRGAFEEAWNLLGPKYQRSFGGFPQFVQGFETTVSSEISDAVPVADGPWMTAVEYRLTAKDKTPEADLVQVFTGIAHLEVQEGQGWKIVYAENRLADQYQPPRW